MTRWWWVRHAPTHATAMVGRSDVAADLGDGAALERLSRALPAAAPVIASGLRRAETTADAIAAGRPRLPPDRRLAEMDFGRWEMHTFDTVAAETPAYLGAFHEHPGGVRAPAGESWDDLGARVADVVAALSHRFAGGDIVAVAHLGPILSQLQRACALKAYAALGHRIDALSITCLAHDGEGWRVERMNHRP